MTRLLLALLLFCGCRTVCLADAVASTQPASTSDLIGQLGDPDPQVRQRATRELWSRGKAAAPELQQAAAGGDPEIARRAKSILRDFDYGLYPDAPTPVFELLEQYRSGDINQKRNAVWQLGSQGVPGLRVLLKLRQDEKDPILHQAISQVLSPREHEVAVLMLAEGQTDEVTRVLRESSLDSPVAAQDYAALLLRTGKLPQALEAAKRQTLSPRNAPLVLALARAAGDLATARKAAEASGSNEILDAFLTNQGDWQMLARRLKGSPGRMEASERLGYLCAYYRLSGDENDFRATALELVAHAQHFPEDHSFCAENLFLNGLPKEAVSVLMHSKDYVQASNYLAPRLQLKEALELPALAEQQQPADALNVRARSIETLHFAGQMDKAKFVMDDVAQANRLRHDFGVWATLIGAAQEMGMPAKADEFCVVALASATRQDPTAWLFERMRLDDGIAASRWWAFLRQQDKQQSPHEALKRLHSIFDQSIPKEDLSKLAEKGHDYAKQLSEQDAEDWEATLGDTLAARGLTREAAECFTKLSESSKTPAMLIRAGDFETSNGNWSAASEDYHRAWEQDRTRAASLFLHGWALTHCGQQNEGRRLMEQAHTLPLGSETDRLDLLTVLIAHKLTADADLERQLILTTTAPRSMQRNEVLRQLGQEAARRQDDLAAADLYEKAFLQNLSNNISFSEPWANVVVPALIHKVRALGLIKAGKADDAVRETKIMLDLVPADADGLIEIVNAMDNAGKKALADLLYHDQIAIYRKLITDFPQSGPGHNQLAWAQVMCHRDLDDALANARRAVELEPTSTASIDTLAEVDFARHDLADAIAQMKKCIELEPHVKRHRQQLARFEAALHGTTQPAPAPPSGS